MFDFGCIRGSKGLQAMVITKDGQGETVYLYLKCLGKVAVLPPCDKQ